MLRPIRTTRRCPGFLFLIFVIPLVMLLLSVSPAESVEEPPKQDNSSFTNKDLEPYRPTATENQPLYQQGSGPDNTRLNVQRKTEKQTGHGEQEYWCSKGRQARKKVTKAHDEVEALKKLLTEFRETEVTSPHRKRSLSGKNVRKTEKNLAAAQKRLKDKEVLLGELEDDARRQNIPAGWTRCQFE